eukprot:TRINITY_DN1218_c0_g1_i2.p1 TRINITY_DN1218_c0_g1~~TRINITY_DN1218_c0_g1_i2.p1  ORF type:complete len:256 (+),score=51.40 TRINITY_DN1218_c0_g1_i2:1144-1911(+)
MRTVWDYTEKYEEFCEWLDKIENLGISVYNETKFLRWNSHKKYLLDLEKEGVDVIPTVLLEKGCKYEEVCKIANNKEWPYFVIKPCVSSCGQNCHKVESVNISQKIKSQIQNLLNTREMLLQKFISSVKVKGEISLVFFGEKFSHAILKRPLQNEFRVQGGKIESVNAEKYQIEFALKCIRAAKKFLFKKNDKDKLVLIARVDLLFSNDGKQMYLNEFEAFDPELFLRKSPSSTNLYVNSIMDIVKKGDYKNKYY